MLLGRCINFVRFLGLALKCKKCKDLTCDTLEEETCAVDAGTKEAACLTHIYQGVANESLSRNFTDQGFFSDSSNDKKVVKKCVSFERNVPFVCNKTAVKEITCDTCKENFCNSERQIDANVLLVFAALPLILKLIQ
jgi:hypothetical protein